MATKATVINTALRHLGIDILTSGPNDEPARAINELYDAGLIFCLEQGHWKFASKIAALTASVTEIPTIGYNNAFAKPANYVRLNRICSDSNLVIRLPLYDERAGFWYADETTIYIDYVSSEATALGGYLAGWPNTYAEYVALYLAYKVSQRLQPAKEEYLKGEMEIAKLNALSKDSILGTLFISPGQLPPPGASNGNQQ